MSPRAVAVAAALSLAGSAVESQDCTWTEPLKGETRGIGRLDVSSFGADSAAAGLATDSAGMLYATHPDGGYVDVRDPSGLVIAKQPDFERPYAVAVDASGGVYVGEQLRGRVGVFDSRWKLQHYLGQGDGEFVTPTGIAVDPGGAGWVYVTDGGTHEVRVYAADGSFLFAFGGPGSGPGLFDFPAAIHLVPSQDGNPVRLFVSDQNNDRVQILDEDGNFLSCIGGSGGSQRFGRIAGLAMDDRGRLFVADAFQGQVWFFGADGALIGNVGEFGSMRGLMTPLGVAFHGNSLYVASYNTGKIETFAFRGGGPPSVTPRAKAGREP